MMMANRTTFKKSNLGSGQGWHKDSYSKQFKSIIYLSDVNKENGPFQILKKSNSNFFMMKFFFKLKNKYPSTRFSHSEIKNILNNDMSEIEELNAKAGTLILVDTNYIHRGKPLNSGKRYALTNYFFPETEHKNHDGHFTPLIKKINK
jgi:ectoine hydroxylase-related dioxygenase (phytanoyl-CoA dioxygenase family)